MSGYGKSAMRGYRTQIEANACYEAGHALAALKVGRYVTKVVVDHKRPGNGVMYYRMSSKNPFRLK
jgi:hypothetical protein